MKIPVFSPWVGENEKRYVNDCLDTEWISQGKYVSEFEKQFAAYSECEFGISCSNCTTALHLAGIAIGLQPGDEVLVASSTNMATAFSMVYCGAKPVPIDIEKDTWQIDASKIEAAITDKTKAIVVVHLFGQPVDMDAVLDIARRHDLKVIEDAAESHGARYKGKRVGSLGDIGCFSFYSNKIITCGEGGMVTTNNPEYAEKIAAYRSFCYGKTVKFQHDAIGYNYRLSNMSAALGLGQLERIDDILARKRHIYETYVSHLSDVEWLDMPVIRDFAESVVWMFNVAVNSDSGVDREAVRAKLQAAGVETREAFVPVNQQKVFIDRGWVTPDQCPVANEIMKTGFYLPSGLHLTESDIITVCQHLKSAIAVAA